MNEENTPVVENGADNAEKQPATATNANQPDLSSLFVDGQAGVFDENKIVGLMNDLANQKKSTSYYQSLYMKKNEVPETADGYAKNFKPDSMYEKAMEQENVKNMVKAIREWGIENQIGERSLNKFLDYTLRSAVEKNILDMRSEEQIKEEAAKAEAEELKKLQPMLERINKSKEENDAILEHFLNSPNVFTNDPEMKKYITELADSSAMGYKLLTMLTHTIEHRGIPVVSGTVAGKDKAALMAEIQKIDDPNLRHQKMKEFYGE